MQACGTWIEARLAELEARRKTTQQRIDDHARAIVADTRELAVTDAELRALRELRETETSRYRDELGRMLEVPGVARVSVERDAVAIFTESIVVEYEGRRYEIGEFRLDLFFNGLLRLRNLRNTGRYDLYDHPHVRDGEPCLGNIGDGLAKLIASSQFSVAARVLIEYLHGYDPRDAYCEIHHWKEVTPDGAHGESGRLPAAHRAH